MRGTPQHWEVGITSGSTTTSSWSLYLLMLSFKQLVSIAKDAVNHNMYLRHIPKTRLTLSGAKSRFLSFLHLACIIKHKVKRAPTGKRLESRCINGELLQLYRTGLR